MTDTIKGAFEPFGCEYDTHSPTNQSDAEIERLAKANCELVLTNGDLHEQIARLTRERDEARNRLRITAQILIEYVGASGPMDAEDAARATVERAKKAEESAMRIALAVKNLLERMQEDDRRARDAGLTFSTVRDALSDYEAEEISFGRLVELVRAAANALASNQKGVGHAKGEEEG